MFIEQHRPLRYQVPTFHSNQSDRTRSCRRLLPYRFVVEGLAVVELTVVVYLVDLIVRPDLLEPAVQRGLLEPIDQLDLLEPIVQRDLLELVVQRDLLVGD